MIARVLLRVTRVPVLMSKLTVRSVTTLLEERLSRLVLLMLKGRLVLGLVVLMLLSVLLEVLLVHLVHLVVSLKLVKMLFVLVEISRTVHGLVGSFPEEHLHCLASDFLQVFFLPLLEVLLVLLLSIRGF